MFQESYNKNGLLIDFYLRTRMNKGKNENNETYRNFSILFQKKGIFHITGDFTEFSFLEIYFFIISTKFKIN